MFFLGGAKLFSVQGAFLLAVYIWARPCSPKRQLQTPLGDVLLGGLRGGMMLYEMI